MVEVEAARNEQAEPAAAVDIGQGEIPAGCQACDTALRRSFPVAVGQDEHDAARGRAGKAKELLSECERDPGVRDADGLPGPDFAAEKREIAVRQQDVAVGCAA